MAHNSSLPTADREESPEKYVIKWGGLVVAIYPEEDKIRMDIDKPKTGSFYCMSFSPEDVDRATTQASYLLPEMFKEINEAFRCCARIVRKG
jgi:hypothetical protein